MMGEFEDSTVRTTWPSIRAMSATIRLQSSAGARRSPRSGALLCVALLLTLASGAPVPAQDQEPIKPEVFDLTSPKQGSSWVALSWDSTVVEHDVLYGELPKWRKKAPKLDAIRDISAFSYSVAGLNPDTVYEFRIRARPAEDSPAKPVVSEPLVVRTLAREPRTFAGLTFWPRTRLSTSSSSITQACIEAYRGKLYVLQVEKCALTLSRVQPENFRVEWTRDIAPAIDEEPLCYEAPDTCIFQDRLWITWHVRKPGNGDGPGTTRQRLAFYDLSGDLDEDDAEKMQTRTSALLQIMPSVAGSDTRHGSVTPYLDSLWVGWLETSPDGGEGAKSLLKLAAYEPWRGRLATPVTWTECPVTCPGAPSITQFAGELAVLFSDGTDPDAASIPLMFARFNGRRLHDVRTLRKLGRSLKARGVQLYDRFHFVYQSDAEYPTGDGMFFDIAWGRLGVSASVGPERQVRVSALPYEADMKYNDGPDVTALGDVMYAVYSKRDEPAGTDPGAPGRGFGTYIGRITRALGE